MRLEVGITNYLLRRAAGHLQIITMILALPLCFMGCAATVTHRPVAAADDDDGIRYYQASPYLLVYSDSKGGLQWRILYLPDQTKKMAVEPHVFGGRLELTLYFRNGILAGSAEVGDTTEMSKAVIAAVQAAIPLIGMLGFDEKQTPPTVPAPELYKIVVEAQGVRFVGGRGDSDIVVTIKDGNL